MSTSKASLLSLSATVILATSFQMTAIARGEHACPSSVSDAADSIVIGSSCYALFTTELSWSNARSACANLGGSLAVVRSQSENNAIHSILSGTEPWLGATDNASLISDASEGEYFWVGDSAKFWTGGSSNTTGVAVGGAYENWRRSSWEPNDFGSNEDCSSMFSNGEWNDADCSITNEYVCQVNTTRDEDTSSAARGGGGIRAKTLQNLIDMSLQRKSVPAPAPATHPAATGGPDTGANQKRVCARVLKNFGENPKMLAKINARLQKGMGFSCQD